MIALRRRLSKAILWLSLLIGIAVALGVPAGYFIVAYSRLAQELSLISELSAGRVSKYIYIHRDLWEFHAMRLAEIVQMNEVRDVAFRQRILTSAGEQVLQTGSDPPWPFASATAVATVAGAPVATVETASSLRRILLTTTIVAVGSGLIGLAIVVLVRVVPLRMLERTLGELAATHARYRLLFELNPFPVAVVHRDTKAFLAVNPAASQQYGWTPEEALGMTTADIRASGSGARYGDSNIGVSIDGSTTFRRQHRQRRKDGTIIEVEVYSRAIEFEGQPAFLSLGVDVTDRNRFEQQLRQSQKMEAVGQLTGGIAHDFNNLLNIIVTQLEFLEEDDQLPAAAKARVGKITDAIDRATRLTRQLLSFSRKQPLRAEVVCINELIRGTAELLGRTLGSRVEVESSLDPKLWPVEVDPTQLEAALLNLCLNARDAMPDGGTLRIATRNVTLDEQFAASHLGAAIGDHALLSVTDTGVGMPPHVLAQVFEPFFTTKSTGKGTGLGLSMVHGFINQSGGYVTAASEPGKGSTFTIYLPRTRATQVPSEKAAPQMVEGDGERILVVEDQPELKLAIVEQLRALGYEVDHAADGEEALGTFSSAAQPFDLLLTDVVMPRMNGRELAETVSARWPTTRIIFMSGYAESEVVHDGIIDANVRLLTKPIRRRDLAKAVRDCLSHRGSLADLDPVYR